jgi:Fe-S cluster assembly iron-binding protein IscA
MTMLTLTQPAATMLSDVRSQQGIPEDSFLRIAASTDGQQGISLGFVDQPFDGDQTSDAHGLGYCVAPEVADALDGAKIDLQDPGVDSTSAGNLVIVPAD